MANLSSFLIASMIEGEADERKRRTMLSDYLKSDLPITSELRAWMAALFDAGGSSPLKSTLGRRMGRPRGDGFDRRLAIARDIESGMSASEAAKLHRVSASTVHKARREADAAKATADADEE